MSRQEQGVGKIDLFVRARTSRRRISRRGQEFGERGQARARCARLRRTPPASRRIRDNNAPTLFTNPGRRANQPEATAPRPLLQESTSAKRFPVRARTGPGEVDHMLPAGDGYGSRGLVGTPGARRNRGRGRIHDLRKVGRCARITVKSLERDGPDQEWPTVCRAGSRRKGRRRRRTGEEPDRERGLEPRGTAPSEKPNPWPLHSTSSRSVRIAWSGSIVQGMMVRSTLPV